MLQLSIVIVNWNVRDLVRRCLESLRNLDESIEAEVVVVDNASSDCSIEMVRAEFPDVRVMANIRNVGFGAANNQALKETSGRYVLFLNPDTEVRPNAIERLLAFIDQRPQVACVGPKLLNPDGSVQSSRRSFPRLSTFLVESTILQRYLGGLGGVRRFYRAQRSEDEPQPVDWLVGACLLVRRSALDEVGPFDERFFMYSEEMDLCYRLKQASYEVWYVPEAEVVHHEGASSRQDLFRRNVNFHESRYRFFAKHHGLAAALALRWFVFGTFLFQLAEEAGKFLLQPAKRDMRRERVHLYRRIVRWYLSAS
ncbi:MAG TPA: glycosyltransferase family 2 protein [Chloroflexota bacterium]|nr:glycosyltransferase family 2 protein [Chloroflexota bacterium]